MTENVNCSKQADSNAEAERQPAPEQSDGRQKEALRLLKKAALWVFALWAVVFIAMVLSAIRAPSPNDWITRLGALGDSFGWLNALFTGLALAAVAVSIWYQREDVQHQFNEMEKSRQVTERLTRETRRQVRIAIFNARLLRSQVEFAMQSEGTRRLLELHDQLVSMQSHERHSIWFSEESMKSRLGRRLVGDEVLLLLRSADIPDFQIGSVALDGILDIKDGASVLENMPNSMRMNFALFRSSLLHVLEFWTKLNALDEADLLERDLIQSLFVEPLVGFVKVSALSLMLRDDLYFYEQMHASSILRLLYSYSDVRLQRSNGGISITRHLRRLRPNE